MYSSLVVYYLCIIWLLNSDDVIMGLKDELPSYMATQLMELQQMQISLNDGKTMQVKSPIGYVVVELSFYSSPDLQQLNGYSPFWKTERQTNTCT